MNRHHSPDASIDNGVTNVDAQGRRMATSVGRRALVSVIIPTRNRAALLPRALDSVCSQEGSGHGFDQEVIVVDDASSDPTPAVVRRYPDVRYLRLATRRGPAAARNAGIAASRGTVVAFLDDDDMWLPHRLRTQLPLLEGHPEVGAVFGQALMRSGARDTLRPDASRVLSGWIFGALLHGEFNFMPSVVMVRREILERTGYFDETLSTAEDWDMWLRLSFSFQWLFVPGSVAVCWPSSSGEHLTAVASGVYGPTMRRIAEKALAMLPDTGAYAGIRRDVRARVELRVAERLSDIGKDEAARPHLFAALRQHPGIVREAKAREAIARIAGLSALASTSPLLSTRTFCEGMKHLARGRSVMTSLWMRRVVAQVWGQVAGALGDARGARYAAREAVVHNPFLLGTRRWWQLIARTLRGRGTGT
jgi:glycosyltransferase involved in cell wall biosynthesis